MSLCLDEGLPERRREGGVVVSVTSRMGIGFVEINRSGLYPRTYISNPAADPEERSDQLAQFMQPFDGKLVKITVEVLDRKKLLELDPEVAEELKDVIK